MCVCVCVQRRVPATPDPSGLSVVMDSEEFTRIRVRYAVPDVHVRVCMDTCNE